MVPPLVGREASVAGLGRDHIRERLGTGFGQSADRRSVNHSRSSNNGICTSSVAVTGAR